mgnify:CR=1 FL=1
MVLTHVPGGVGVFELVILHLTAETFVPIYAAALQHKAAKMAEGGQRKAAVVAAQTVEEVEAI